MRRRSEWGDIALNVFTFTGRVIGNPQNGHTRAGKATCTFIVESDREADDLPLRFTCVTFAGVAEQAAEITPDDHLFLSGKIVGNSFTRAMNVIVNHIKFLGGNK